MALTTDVAPRIHLEPREVLQDEQRVKRLIVALSRGIFYVVDDATTSEVLQECLKICGGSEETLSQVLQTKFFGGHTPFYWAITNKDPHSHTSPLLAELLLRGGPLRREIQQEIVAAFQIEFDSVLYNSAKDKLTEVETLQTHSESFLTHDEDIPICVVSSHNATHSKVRFEIPKFFERLLVDADISLTFYALGTTFSLTASMINEPGARPSWRLNITEIIPPERSHIRALATVEIGSGSAICRSGNVSSPNSPGVIKLPPPDLDLVQFYVNPYTSNRRGMLVGTINLKLISG